MRARSVCLLLAAAGCDGSASAPTALPADGGVFVADASIDAAPEAASPGGPAVPLPDGAPGIGFDDLRFSRALARLLVPAGRTGDLDLVDPASRAVTVIGGFSAASAYTAGHDVGASSADEGDGWIFAADHGSMKLVVVDPTKRAIVASTPLSGAPDYVRYVAATHEVWVTEPAAQGIEIFTLGSASTPSPTHAGFVGVAGGAESLVIDGTRGRAYTNTFEGSTIAVDVAARAVVGRWPNGCVASRGIALDEARGIVFAGCAEGAVGSLDAATGTVFPTLKVGAGVDIIDYAPALRHLYVPSSDGGTMAFVGIPTKGEASLLGTLATAVGAHCVVADGSGQIWVCDPARGQLLVFADPYPTSVAPPADAGAVADATSDVATCTQSCGADKCAWDPYQKGGMGAFGCIPQSWTTEACNGVGAIGACDVSGAMQRCTSAGLIQDQCAAGCGLRASSSCGGLASCVECMVAVPEYCAGAASAPICQGELRIECYDNSYTLDWCPDTGTTCQCAPSGCACR